MDLDIIKDKIEACERQLENLRHEEQKEIIKHYGDLLGCCLMLTKTEYRLITHINRVRKIAVTPWTETGSEVEIEFQCVQISFNPWERKSPHSAQIIVDKYDTLFLSTIKRSIIPYHKFAKVMEDGTRRIKEYVESVIEENSPKEEEHTETFKQPEEND